MFECRADGGELKLKFPRFQKFKLRDLPMHSLLFRSLGFATPDPQQGHKIPLSKPKSVLTKLFLFCFVFLTGSTWAESLFVAFFLMKEKFFH